MTIRNEDVARAWRSGQPCRSANLSTDGERLWSYRLEIGFTHGWRKILIDYRSPHTISITTSHHVSLAARWAHVVLEPTTTRKSPCQPETVGMGNRMDWIELDLLPMKSVCCYLCGETINYRPGTKRTRLLQELESHGDRLAFRFQADPYVCFEDL